MVNPIHITTHPILIEQARLKELHIQQKHHHPDTRTTGDTVMQHIRRMIVITILILTTLTHGVTGTTMTFKIRETQMGGEAVQVMNMRLMIEVGRNIMIVFLLPQHILINQLRGLPQPHTTIERHPWTRGLQMMCGVAHHKNETIPSQTLIPELETMVGARLHAKTCAKTVERKTGGAGIL